MAATIVTKTEITTVVTGRMVLVIRKVRNCDEGSSNDRDKMAVIPVVIGMIKGLG